jgi:ribonuclease HII
MENLCAEFPEYQEKYDWINNKGYGTTNHLTGIRQWGICSHHRRSFGICKEYC